MTNSKELKEAEKLRKDMYIFGMEESFEYGTIRHLTFEEYVKDAGLNGLLSLNVLHIYYQYYKAYEKEKKLENEVLDFLEELKKMELLDIVNSSIGMDLGLKIAYLQIFDRLISVEEDDVSLYDELYEETYGELPKYDEYGEYIPIVNEEGEPLTQPTTKQMVIYKIFSDKDLFMKIRKLIMDMNVITEEKITENPEINKFLEMSKKTKKGDSAEESFVDVLTSIVASSGHSYETVGKWNLHQVYGTYQRIATIKDYETNVLFATVAPDVKIESWSKHIDLFKEESTGKKKSELMKDLKGAIS